MNSNYRMSNPNFNLIGMVETVASLSEPLKYLLYNYLHDNIKNNETDLIPISRNANSTDFLKELLNRKKETAIDELNNILPYIHTHNINAKEVVLKILPVFLSYSSLYDMRTSQMQQILDIIKVHSVFAADQHVFKQWFIVFERRKNSRKIFSYKDETFVYNLPKVDPFPGDLFVEVVGYSDVALLRAFHRWLRLHRLHKYLYLFANLKYEEILSIDEQNIDEFQNSIKLFKMTMGAKNKILREIAELRRRKVVILENVLLKRLLTSTDIEMAIRDIKKVMRTPIKVNDEMHENLPKYIVRALGKVCKAVLEHVGLGEGMIPLYGLLISILKEAWNYPIFSASDKECFNFWREAVSQRINNNVFNVNNVVTTPEAPHSVYGDFSLGMENLRIV